MSTVKEHLSCIAQIDQDVADLRAKRVKELEVVSAKIGYVLAFWNKQLPKGFPRGYLMREKSVKGFATGDMVRATVTKGKKIGNYIGRVAVRASGSFNIKTKTETVQGIGHKCCTIIQRGDGYSYHF